MRAAGEVEPAHDRGVLVHVVGKEIGHQFRERLFQSGHLLRELEDRRARLHPALVVHPHRGLLLDDVKQLVEMPLEHVNPLVGGGEEWQREAPNLAALFVPQVAEHLNESDDEVALGDQQVHGQHHFQAPHHLVDAFTQGLAQGCEFFGVALQIRHAHRDQDTVHRFFRPGLAKQVEKCQPFLPVVILRGPTASRIQDDRFVGQPPIAVACPAHTLDPSPLGVGEGQPRAPQRRRLAGPGRPNDDVPRQRAEGVATPVAQARGL